MAGRNSRALWSGAMAMVILWAASGCGSVPLPSQQAMSEAVREAQANTPPAGHAGLYIVRPGGVMGAGSSYYFDLDHRAWGNVDNGVFMWDPSPAGHHVLQAYGGREIPFDAKAGQTYYFEAGIMSGVKAVSESQGKAAVAKSQLDPTHWKIRQYLANWSEIRSGASVEEVVRLLGDPLFDAAGYAREMRSGRRFTGSSPSASQIVVTPDSYAVTYRTGDTYGTGDYLAGTGEGTFEFLSGVLGYRLFFVNGALAKKMDARTDLKTGLAANYPSSKSSITVVIPFRVR